MSTIIFFSCCGFGGLSWIYYFYIVIASIFATSLILYLASSRLFAHQPVGLTRERAHNSVANISSSKKCASCGLVNRAADNLCRRCGSDMTSVADLPRHRRDRSSGEGLQAWLIAFVQGSATMFGLAVILLPLANATIGLLVWLLLYVWTFAVVGAHNAKRLKNAAIWRCLVVGGPALLAMLISSALCGLSPRYVLPLLIASLTPSVLALMGGICALGAGRQS